MSSGIERGAQGGDAAVHHVAGRNDVRSGGGVAEGLLAKNVHGFIVEDDEGSVGLCFYEAVVAIGVVGIEGDVGDDAHLRAGGLDGADEAGDEAIGVVTLGGIGGFEGVVNF